MKTWTRWQDWTVMLLGVVLLLSPVVLGPASTIAFALNAFFIGVLSIAIAILALAQPQRFVTEWVTLFLGAWLFISPWLLAFAAIGAAWLAWIIGLCLVVIAGWTLLEARRPHAHIPV